MANQTARLRITPTTAAVIAESAALRALLPRIFSTYGAPRKIHRKHGVNVTQVASRPPSVPATSGFSAPGSRNAPMKPTNWSTMMPRRRLGHAEPVQHLARREPVVTLDGLLGDVGQHRVGAAEGDHRHLGEEQGDLAEHVRLAEGCQQYEDGNEPERQPRRGNAERAGDARAGIRRQFVAEQGV